MKKLALEDLVPREVSFTLEEVNGKPASFILSKFSLAARIWVKRELGPDFSKMFEDRDIERIAKLTYYLLKDKEQFPTEESFFQVIGSIRDQAAIIEALLVTIGIDKPTLEKLRKIAEKDVKENPPVPQAATATPTGATSTTDLPASTVTP